MALVFVGLFFIGAISLGILFVTFKILSQIITKSLIILLQYLPFSQVNVLGF